ncbi:NUMOD4 domain-containing protein [Paenibacillus gansuensis]|uniref:NUMOD4 domain-containing protein n=1 Tax=Paenibacillus gansuensis TaxID=306542 RepID=A0ABW5P7G0_9BACL
MIEERRSIKGYEGIYDITRSGRIISVRNNRVRHRSGNEYGFANVHLNKNGERRLCKTFQLWKESFSDIDPNVYKGM